MDDFSELINTLLRDLDALKKKNNTSLMSYDLSDIGNEIGFIIGNRVKNSNDPKLLKENFMRGLKHGFSLTDGTH